GNHVQAYGWQVTGDVRRDASKLILSFSNGTDWERPDPSAQGTTDELLVAHEFHVTEGGGFINKTLKEMGSREFQTILTAACAAYGVDCSSAAGGIRQAAEIGSPIVGQTSSNVYITGNVIKHDGEEWYGIYRAPLGYEICDAKLNYGGMSITGPS